MQEGRGETEDLIAGPDHGTAHVAGRQHDLPGRGRQSLDVIGHQRAVGQVEAGEEHVVAIVVAVHGQVGERRPVKRAQRGLDCRVGPDQRGAARVEGR